ncbi:MAG: cold shock domain-containing protein [Holophagales bacterium]|nr:cold shock domain-containing protein [Holophagales bacterium]
MGTSAETDAAIRSTGSGRHEGIIKWYSLAKGYGFIDSEDLSREVFVHHSAIEGIGSLAEGDRVRFELAEGPKGPAALRVVLS